MKTFKMITTVIALMLFVGNNSFAQIVFSADIDNGIGVEQNMATFTITDLKMKETKSGFTFEWSVVNQVNVNAYEIQISEDNKNFTTIKKVQGKTVQEGKYQIPFNNTILLSDTIYYRIKTIFADGFSTFTEIGKTKIKNM